MNSFSQHVSHENTDITEISILDYAVSKSLTVLQIGIECGYRESNNKFLFLIHLIPNLVEQYQLEETNSGNMVEAKIFFQYLNP